MFQSLSKSRVVALLLSVAAASPVFADDDKAAEPDPLALAAMLIGDGHYDRAGSVLLEVDVKKEGLDLAKFYTLKGMVELHSGQHKSAVSSFARAQKEGQKDPVINLYLAQAYYGLKQYKSCLSVLDVSGAAIAKLKSSWLLRAQANWRLGDRPAAWKALVRGQKRFPKQAAFERYKVLLLVDLHLYQSAVDLGVSFLRRQDSTVDDFLSLSEALLKAKEYEKASLLMEQALISFPGNHKVLLQLATIYYQSGKPLAAARLFERAALKDPRYAGDAAELFRRSGRVEQALYINMREPDQKKKFRQRMGLLVEAERFERACALAPRIQRLGLVKDEEVAYALAYAFFKTGQYVEAEKYLKKVVSPKRFGQVTAIRDAMAKCAERSWTCL